MNAAGVKVRSPLAKQLLTTQEVAAKCGVSLRELQWWDERCLVRPQRGIGNVRLWDEESLGRVRLIRDLRIKGVSLQSVRSVLARVSAPDGWMVLLHRRRHIQFLGCSPICDRALEIAARAEGPVSVVKIGSDGPERVRPSRSTPRDARDPRPRKQKAARF